MQEPPKEFRTILLRLHWVILLFILGVISMFIPLKLREQKSGD